MSCILSRALHDTRVSSQIIFLNSSYFTSVSELANAVKVGNKIKYISQVGVILSGIGGAFCAAIMVQNSLVLSVLFTISKR